MSYKEEDLVYWNDPDGGRCSQSGIITEIRGDHYVIAGGNGAIIEAPASELEPL
jgi:hypothetical protein